ncbi:MAG: pentapeptide repeat-containing protein [Fimbriimonadaceae bacterium]
MPEVKIRKHRLDASRLPLVEGRRLISGLVLAEPAEPISRVEGAGVAVTAKSAKIFKQRWDDLQFVDCDFTEILFIGLRLRSVVFDNCIFNGAGFWMSQVSETKFLSCSLVGTALGGVNIFPHRSTNTYTDVSFEGCDMREISCSSELYRRCQFNNCDLKNVDFGAARFIDCRFVGSLDGVMFRSEQDCKMGERNTMNGSDFKEADVSHCRFLNIDVSTDWFGENEDIIFLRNGPADWLMWLSKLSNPTSGVVWYAKEQARTAGTPCIVSRRSLTTDLAEHEVDLLQEIGKGN